MAVFDAHDKAVLKTFISMFVNSTLLRFASLENFSKATSFNNSILIGKLYGADDDNKVFVTIVDLFNNVQNAFENPDDLDEESKMALRRLLDIYATSHTLLKELKVQRESEAAFNVFFASEVVHPLTGGVCIINSVNDNAEIKNKFLKEPADFDLGGMAMGYADGYYGEPDILACPKEKSPKVETPGAVAIQSVSTVEETVEETDETVADDAQHSDSIGHAKKRRKSNKERASSTAGGSRNKTVIEGKKMVTIKTTISALSQCIATAVTFGRIQQIRHQELHTFPTLRVHPIGIDVVLYNATSDHLMLGCFAWSRQALFMLWLVLHHNIFSFLRLPEKYESYRCGFLAYIENSGAMRTEPEYLISKGGFKINEEELEREFRVVPHY